MTDPRKCARGCGFFGQPENKFFCSKCYNDYLKEEILKSAAGAGAGAAPTSPQASTTNPFPWVNGGGVTDSTAVVGKSKRCLCCKKKVGLTSFECRCGGVFCGRHRYPEEHACTFDFKAVARRVLAKENPLVMADKLRERI